MTEETKIERNKRKLQRNAEKEEERYRVNKIRQRMGISLLESSDEEEQELSSTNDDIQSSSTPAESNVIDNQMTKEDEKPKKFGVREWDRGKVGHMRWIEAQREDRDEQFAPPASYREIKQLAEIAVRDPELYQFLKKEEADIFDEQDKNNRDEIEIEREDDELSDDEISKSEEQISESGDGHSSVSLKPDPETGRLIVSDEFVDFLESVLSDPESVGKPTFRYAVETSVKAFISCIARVGGGYSKLTKEEKLDYVVYDEQIFDRVLRLCFQTMGRVLYRLLNPVKKSIKDDQKNKYKKCSHFKNWQRHKSLAKCYLEAVHIFLLELNSNQVIVAAIRAVADLVDLFIHFPKLTKNIIKCLVRIWSQQQIEEARCIAFVVLCKISRMDSNFFPKIYKASFIEFTLMYPKLAYQYAFVYIRQFAIHIRNAMIAKRKDLIQRVYNWQFLKGLLLWTSLICEGTQRFTSITTEEKSSSTNNFDEDCRNNWFKELTHPLVEIVLIMGRLFPSSKYLPIRIHCLRMLLNIQRDCNVFVPALAFAIELLDDLAQMDVKKPKAGKGTTKGVNLEKMLRLSNEQFEDAGVRLHLAQQLFLSSEEAIKLLKSGERHPETLLTPLQGRLRIFLKKCANREHVRIFTKLKSQMI
uniref:Nucleolar complex protein 2 homolog n=1 Tax=Meloidogyne javanica TaxID=6303 RepID=A0A915MYG1_MELJA